LALNPKALKAALRAYDTKFPEADYVSHIGVKAALNAYHRVAMKGHVLSQDEIVSRYTMQLIAMGCPEDEANAIKRNVEGVLDGLVRRRASPVERDARDPETARPRVPKPFEPS
jgi:hypothetical protein